MRLFVSPAERQLLGLRPLSGPTPWLVAIMSFSILLIAAAGLALANGASRVAGSVDARYSIELPAGSDRAPRLLAGLRSDPAIENPTALSEAEVRQSLRRWLGSAADSDDLPVPALISFDLRRGAAIGGVERRVRTLAPDAVLVAHSAAVGPVVQSLRTLQWTALALVLLLAAASAAAVVLAARAALDTHRSTIDILHGIGATDAQLTRLFERKIGLDALAGSVAGATAAALVLLLLAAGSAYLGELTGGATLAAGDLILLALVPLALIALSVAVARAAVLARLRAEP